MDTPSKRLYSFSPENLPSPKRKKYLATFQPTWVSEFPWLKDSKLKGGGEYAICTSCKMDSKVDHSGKTDMKNHTDTEKHKQLFYVSFIVFPSVQYF